MIRSIALATWPIAYREILSAAQLLYMLDVMYSEAALLDQMTTGHQFMLASRGDAAGGFAGIEHRYQASASTRLHKLYVLPQEQGTGTGGALYEVIEKAARSVGDTQVELNVNRFNPARTWYERKGFHIVRDEVIDIGHGFVMDDHVMVKELR